MTFAHSLKGAPPEKWHSLEVHLRDTATAAAQFARAYGEPWAFLAGLWHDVGKYAPEFQRMIGADPDAHCEVPGRVDHSSAGALLAARLPVGLPVAFVIAGHHAGLSDSANLSSRLKNKASLLEAARQGGLPTDIENEPLPTALPPWCSNELQADLWTRLVYSSLVDADFLDTERFYQGRPRGGSFAVSLVELQDRLDAHLETLVAQAPRSAVNAMRARVLKCGREAAEWAPGNFTLTVPTGGGKTFASMAFALHHAVRYGLRRVLVVIPFTSIIEQNAAQYEKVFGEGVVIEHHSDLDPERETARNRLASENWDAPIIVTTTVQFFESLFSNRSSRCRKLHNIAESVVIFDEVQTFPPGLLSPIIDALVELSAHYGASLVFCTATQPALQPRLDTVPPRPGIPNLREIVADPQREFDAVRDRYIVELPASPAATTWETLAEKILSYPRVLVVVHRREDAATLAKLLGEESQHLSARMCPAHRKEALCRIRSLLESGGVCRVVSTQLIEAGVDVDFPVVFRAMAGADSLAQAAGRCNREGRLPEPGLFRIFVAPTEPPPGILRLGKEQAEMLLRAGRLDLLAPETFLRYFQGFYSMCDLDAKGVNQARAAMNFETTAKLFQMIDDPGLPVVAPYGNAQARLARLRGEGANRQNLRALQPFLVNLYPQEILQLAAAHAIERIEDVVWAVTTGYEHIYDDKFGFSWKLPLGADPTRLIE